jgi:hypothetical protein
MRMRNSCNPKLFAFNKAETLIEAQSLFKPLNRHFWVGAFSSSACFR